MWAFSYGRDTPVGLFIVISARSPSCVLSVRNPVGIVRVFVNVEALLHPCASRMKHVADVFPGHVSLQIAMLFYLFITESVSSSRLSSTTANALRSNALVFGGNFDQKSDKISVEDKLEETFDQKCRCNDRILIPPYIK